MLSLFKEYLTFDNIYLWTNFGVIPFWIMLIAIPKSRISRILINSVILPLIFGALYIYVIYLAILQKDPFLDIFKLYLSMEYLYTVFSSESLLLIFWLHFLTLNLFLGSWVSRNSVYYNMPRSLVAIPLVLIYFSGPVGLVLYWFIRIFYAKKIGMHD
jgi:hypothetical protein